MSTQLAIPEAQQFAKPEQPQIMDIIQFAVKNNAAIDVIERLAALQKDQLARQAEIEFNSAMNAVQSELGVIAPDLTNPQTRSRYASYAKLDRAIRPVYIKHGFSLSFDTADAPSETVRVVCYVSRTGHTRRYQVDMPADGKGAKGGDVMTKTHASGAAMSYGMRYLLKCIFNIAVGEDDNDGNSYSELLERLEWIQNAKDLPELERLYKAAIKGAKDAKDADAIRRIVQVKDKRKAELS